MQFIGVFTAHFNSLEILFHIQGVKEYARIHLKRKSTCIAIQKRNNDQSNSKDGTCIMLHTLLIRHAKPFPTICDKQTT